MKKNVLISGVSRGLGLETARILLIEGNTVYGISRSYNDDLKKLEEDYPKTFFYKSIDLSKPDTLQNDVFKSFITNKIPLHGLVNNAALAYDDIITNLDLNKLQEMFSVNVYSPFLLVKYAIRNILFNKVKGSIVHVSSISVHTGYKGLAMYAASKGSLEGFSKNTAREWGGLGIRSNCLVAGFMETEMSATLSDDQKNRIYNRTSLKIPTTLHSVASTINFLISDQAESITGQNIHVDSGTI
jgi:3-oxoacyl-[acyl-carrier protein] reductase